MKEISGVFDPKLVHQCAVVSKAVYIHGVGSNSETRMLSAFFGVYPDAIEFVENKETSTEALFVRLGHRLILGFRGTESSVDIATDAFFELYPWRGTGHFHRGFSNAVEKSKDPVLASIRRAIELGVTEVVLTGHSLGGAMAQLYGYLLLDEKIAVEVKNIITFGQPRVANKLAISHYQKLNSKIIRVVNEDDAVTRVPPAIWKHDWTHAGEMLFFSKSGTHVLGAKEDSQDVSKIFDILLSLYQAWREKSIGNEINRIKTPHSMSLYLENVAQLSSGIAPDLKDDPQGPIQAKEASVEKVASV